jgi:hypothetical protein
MIAESLLTLIKDYYNKFDRIFKIYNRIYYKYI